MSHVRAAISRCLEGESLTREAAREAMLEIMRGEASEGLIAAYVVALRMKGETPDEVAGSAEAMRALAVPLTMHADGLVDTCGTGGDGLHTVNVSTGAAFVAAACGARIAKHGNRAVSSRSGSADVLEALGVEVTSPVATVEQCLLEAGVAFLFAPSFHVAMRHAAPVRKALGVRTLFNVLGPLTNPAGARRQVVGVYDRRWVPRLAEVLGILGAERALVVHGSDGMDEITLTGPTYAAEWSEGSMRELVLEPSSFGLSAVSPAALECGDPTENAVLLEGILRGTHVSPARDLVLVNAAAALVVGRRAAGWEEGYAMALAAVETGAAWSVLEQLRGLSRGERRQTEGGPGAGTRGTT